MLLAAAPCAFAQQDARDVVQQAVTAELAADKADDTLWRYQKSEEGGDLFNVVETKDGTIERHIEQHGQPVPSNVISADNEKIQRFIHDPGAQAKQRKDAAHDDKSASELLNLMPRAFIWKIVNQTADEINLSYSPDPKFSPPDMEARVMGGMTGTLVIDKEGHRVKTFKGRLEKDVTIGAGLLARIKSGSTFDVERKKVDNVHWEIYATHVHITGHALFFKTIGSQEDEVKTKWTSVPQNTTLDQAVHLLDEPLK